MADIARGPKSSGGTGFVDGSAILATEVNTDLDTIVNAINGALDEDNISGSAQITNAQLADIANTKVTAHGTTEALFDDVVSAGDTGTPSIPTTNADELKRLRYRIHANNRYFTSSQYRDSGGVMQDLSWTEPPITGRNLFPNPGFEVQSGAANSAPDGWTLEGTPTTVDIEVPDVADIAIGVDKRSVNIVADAADEGVSRILTGLKANTKYLVGMVYKLTTGEVNLTTENGLGSGDYQNIVYNQSTSGTGIEYFQGIVKTDASGADITVKILSSDAADDFNLYYVWFYEMNIRAPFEAPHIPMQTKEDATEAVYPATPTTPAAGVVDWEEITALTIDQYVPQEGYRFVYEATVNWIWDENRGAGVGGPSDSEFTHAHHGLRLVMDSGGADSVIEGPHMIFEAGLDASANEAAGHIVTLRHVLENPTPGLTYTFSVEMGVAATTTNYAWAFVNPLVDTQQGRSTSRLYTERI